METIYHASTPEAFEHWLKMMKSRDLFISNPLPAAYINEAPTMLQVVVPVNQGVTGSILVMTNCTGWHAETNDGTVQSLYNPTKQDLMKVLADLGVKEEFQKHLKRMKQTTTSTIEMESDESEEEGTTDSVRTSEKRSGTHVLFHSPIPGVQKVELHIGTEHFRMNGNVLYGGPQFQFAQKPPFYKLTVTMKSILQPLKQKLLAICRAAELEILEGAVAGQNCPPVSPAPYYGNRQPMMEERLYPWTASKAVVSNDE
jgi:hypothetical protein